MAASTAPAPSPLRCKALDAKKLVAIGATAGRARLAAAANGRVYVFAQDESGGKVTLVSMARDGSKVSKLGKLTAMQPPSALVVDDQAAYLTFRGTLKRIPESGGEPQDLMKNSGKPLALANGKLYALRCDRERKLDELVSVNKTSGEATVIGSIERKSPKGCEYSALAVNEATAFVSDWDRRRLLAISLGDGALRVLVEKQPFPGRIALAPDALLYQSADGIMKLPLAGGAATRFAPVGAMPFESMAWDDTHLYVMNTPAYSMREMLIRIARDGGKREELEYFQVSDVTRGGGNVDVAVDEQCAYIAHDGKNYLEILARAK